MESETKHWCFFIYTMKTASDWIFAVSEYAYSLWNGVYADQQRNLCNSFLLIAAYATLLAQKSNCFEFIAKGDKPSN